VDPKPKAWDDDLLSGKERDSAIKSPLFKPPGGGLPFRQVVARERRENVAVTAA
jgi:hypothetical protein